jgi:iron complex transport system ATP-binding protein
VGGLTAAGLTVGRGGRPVLSDIDLTVAPGEQVALVGANGSGKTTLLRALAGLDRPLAGKIGWQAPSEQVSEQVSPDLGFQPLPAGGHRVRTLGVLFQGEAPSPYTVAEVVTLGLGLDGPPGAEQRRQVASMLRQIELQPMADRRCLDLSGGEWQRAALGRALVAGAGLLLLDEPASQLDPARRAGLRALLDALRPRVAVVLATHDLEQAAACDRVLLLGHGSPLALGPPGEVLTAPLLGRALGVRVRRVDDPEGGPPLFRIVGQVRATRVETEAAPPPSFIVGGLEPFEDSRPRRVETEAAPPPSFIVGGLEPFEDSRPRRVETEAAPPPEFRRGRSGTL